MTTISFARGAPCPEALSGDLVAESAAKALQADATRILSYGTGHGYPPLRDWLGEQYGVPADRVIITNGSLQGFVFLLETALTEGARVAVEAPTYDRALLQLKLHRMTQQPIQVEADGLDVEQLAAECAAGDRPELLYTIPNFQNPSGATLSLDKRKRLVELAEQYDFWILEDDPYGRLRFEGDDVQGIWEIGGLDRVIFTSSFSKTLAPGLRVGYLIAPPALAKEKLAAAAGRTYISPALLSQAAVHRICADGLLPGNIAKVTALMHERRDAMIAGMRHMPAGTAFTPPQGGFFCWAELPEGLSADLLFDRAAEAGIAYVKGSDCFVSGGERTFRLAYSGVSPDEIAEGMARLGAVFSEAAAKAA